MWIKKTEYVDKTDNKNIIIEKEIMAKENEIESAIAKEIFKEQMFLDEITVIDEITDEEITLDVYMYVNGEFVNFSSQKDIWGYVTEKQLYEAILDNSYLDRLNGEVADEKRLSSVEYLVESIFNGQRKQAVDLFIKYEHTFSDMIEYGISIDDLCSFADSVVSKESKC